jgi:hypothetical protein
MPQHQKIEIVYNMYRVKPVVVLGPPNCAMQETYKLGLDRESRLNPTSSMGVGGFYSPLGVCRA